jgi:hypothetical protein
MKKGLLLSFVLVMIMAEAGLGADGTAKPAAEDNILAASGVSGWVANPLVGSHNWKKFFSDEKHTPSKKAESTWCIDSKTVLEPKAEKLTFKEKVLGSEGATLVWVKVIGLKPGETRYLFYGLWQAKSVVLFFGIFVREDGTTYVEEVDETTDIQKMEPGLQKELLENLSNAVFKRWWKVW